MLEDGGGIRMKRLELYVIIAELAFIGGVLLQIVKEIQFL